MRRNLKLLAISIICIGLLAGCTDPHRDLYGKWQVKSTSDLKALGLDTLIFDFQKDGNLRVTIGSVNVNVPYEFANENTIRFSSDGNIAAVLAGQEVTYTISGETLDLISNGQTQKFTRVAGQ